MRTMALVVLIAGVACREPAPQTPVSNATVERVTPPSPRPPATSDRPRALGTDQLEQTYGPVIASGTDAGRPWSMRGQIGTDGAATWLQTGTGGGGGGGGLLPFGDLAGTKLGHFGSLGSGEHRGLGAPRTFNLDGVVSKQTASIDVRLTDGTILPAQIIDTGDPRASFFFVVWSTPANWEAMIARDAAGVELETYRRPQPPAIATPSATAAGSSVTMSATRASATSTGTSAAPNPNSP